MRFCVGLFFLTLTGVVLYNARDAHHIIVALHQDAENSTKISTNLVVASDNVVSLTSQLSGKDGLSATLNGKHGLKEILLNVDKLTADVRQTTITAKNAAAAEKSDVHDAMQAVIRTVDAANTNINGDTGLLRTANNGLTTLNGTLAGLGQLSDEVKGTISRANGLLDSGDIQRLSKNLADSSDSWKSTSKHIDGTAGAAETAMGYIRDDLKPTKLGFWQNIENAAFSTIPGGLVQFFLRWKPQRVQVVGQ